MTYLGAPMRRVLRAVETFVSARVSARKTVAILDATYGESPTDPGDSFAQTVNKRGGEWGGIGEQAGWWGSGLRRVERSRGSFR